MINQVFAAVSLVGSLVGFVVVFRLSRNCVLYTGYLRLQIIRLRW